MIYSYRIEQAIRAATVLHQGQVRKGPVSLPYVTHLFAVAMIVSDYTDDEDTVVAALLHDTLEDTDYTQEELERDFGPDVLTIVTQVSEHIGGPSVPRESWAARKDVYVKQLGKADERALIVSAADKIHNMRATIEDYFENHARYLKDFHGSPDERVYQYQQISNILNRRLTNDIIHEFNHVFDEYKKFITDVQKEIA